MTADGVRRLMTLPDLRMLSLNSAAVGKEAIENLKKDRPSIRLDISSPAKGR